MSDKQQRRGEILARVASGKLANCEAAQLLGVTERQVRRLLQRLHTQGLQSLVHGNSAKAPFNKTDPNTRARIQALAGPGGAYHDFNTCHLQNLLAEREGIEIGRSTLDRLLRTEGLRRPKRSRRRVFRRRERFPREGELLQIDASPHDWLEGRSPDGGTMCLVGGVDDATGKIVHLRFWPTETLSGYLTLVQDVALTHGLPVSYYHDKHTILRSPKEPTIEDELAGREPMSQMQQTLKRLGIESISAHSPQAKGRIERVWRTLQDRLRKEMRLAGVATREEANAFLPEFIVRYNARFAVAPADPEPAWVTLEPGTDLAYYFAQTHPRVVKSDHTLAWRGALLQLTRRKGDLSLAGKSVQVHTDPSGEVFLYHGKTRLAYERLAARPAASPASGEEPIAQPTDKQPGTSSKQTDNAGRRGWLYAGV